MRNFPSNFKRDENKGKGLKKERNMKTFLIFSSPDDHF